MNFLISRVALAACCAALLVAVGCGRGVKTPDGEVVVSAAASLRDAFQEIGRLYEARTGRRVSLNTGSSGALQAQIESGAPADVFASAGVKQMDDLLAHGFIDGESRRDFARNTLVLIVPRASQLNLSGFADLADARVQKIAVGNPKTVPAGQYTAQVFEKAGLGGRLQEKLVLAEDVRQALAYVERGEVEAGVVYATDARAAGDGVRVAATADEGTHDPILYPIAVVKNSKQKQAAREFVELVVGAEGQAVLRKYGFESAGRQ